MQKYYQNELEFNGVCLRNNLPKNKGWSICNKSSWVYINSKWLDSFVCEW